MGEERREDWKRDLDEWRNNVNSAQRSTDQELDDLDLKYEAIDKVLRGDPEQDTDGLIARYHNLENAIQELRAEQVKRKVADVAIKGFKWDFASKVIVQILILIGLLVLGWDKLENLYNKIKSPKEAHYQPSKELQKEIQRDKDRHRKRTTRVPTALPLVSSGSIPTIE